MDHIQGLEEQLRSQTAELSKQRAASSHIQDIRSYKLLPRAFYYYIETLVYFF